MTTSPSLVRTTIVAFVRHYLPGYKFGGPVRTIANMVAALGDELDIRIVTSDRDLDDDRPYSHLTEGDGWKKVGKGGVLYLPPQRKRLRDIVCVLKSTPHDVLYLNSFFDPVFTLKPLLAWRLKLIPTQRCVLAPRGEFSSAALGLKAGRKRAFLRFSRWVGLYRGIEWHASSAYEAADIRREMGEIAQDIRIATDLPDMTVQPLQRERVRGVGEPLRVCFLSRISPMKNLDYALSVLARVTSPVIFTIHGPREDMPYWDRCRQLIDDLPDTITVIDGGAVESAQVVDVLSRQDLLFLPTQGENYGHVIVEALSAGTRVLISDRTQWRGLEDAGVGYDLPLDVPDAFVQAIEAEAQADGVSDSVDRIVTYLAKTLRIEDTIAANRALFSGTTPSTLSD